MPQHLIELFLNDGDEVNVLTIDASDITSVWVLEPSNEELNVDQSPYKTYITTTIASQPRFDFFDNGQFEDRLAYARSAERAIDDPITRPTRAIAAASKGTHSQGLSRAQVEDIAQAMLTPQQFKNAKQRADKAPAMTSAFSEFLARNATAQASPSPTGQALPEIDLGARVRSRTAYPGKTDTTLEFSSEPDPLAPKA
jgi:hypothetical protein